jgi:3D (Asp-Asp-Asp) domain-containing protein
MKELIVKTSLAVLIGSGVGYVMYLDETRDQAKVEQLQESNNNLSTEVKSLKKFNDEYIKVNKELGENNKQLKESLDTVSEVKVDLEKQVVEKNKQIQALQQELKERPRQVTQTTMPSRGHSNVKRTVYVTATAYTSFCDTGCIGKTATGVDVSNKTTYEGVKIIAVDPSIIPLHSLVKVYPKDREPFYAYAKDTGGDIQGHRIDFLISVSNTGKAYDFGKQQNVKVEILREGK